MTKLIKKDRIKIAREAADIIFQQAVDLETKTEIKQYINDARKDFIEAGFET